MHFVRMATLLAAAILSIAADNPPKPNWTGTAIETQRGSHLMGNPEAAVRLVEYLSYTCPHCASFYSQSDGPLKMAYVSSGRVSVEVRHYIRDPVDMAAALLTTCGAPNRFFGNHAAILSRQSKWIGTIQTANGVQKQRWMAGDMPSRLRAIASDFGFYTIMEARGYRRVDLDKCLADQAMMKKLSAQTVEAQELGIAGTPSFLINGQVQIDVHDWRTLLPLIDARLQQS
jgi:protein-disulfide isomerase